MKSNGNSHVSTGKSPVAFNFKVIPEGSLESELQFQLIHFSEARNAAKGGSLIGLELLLIKDEQMCWPFELYVSATVLDYAEIRIVPSPSAQCHPQGFSWTMISNQPSYLNWLGSNPEIAYLVNEEVLTKAETMTIREIFAYIKQESAKSTLMPATVNGQRFTTFRHRLKAVMLTEPVSPIPEERFRFRDHDSLLGLAITNTQLPMILQPLGDKGITIIGGNTIRCFTSSDRTKTHFGNDNDGDDKPDDNTDLAKVETGSNSQQTTPDTGTVPNGEKLKTPSVEAASKAVKKARVDKSPQFYVFTNAMTMIFSCTNEF
ncbi:hypothetical protein DY000_02040823 [Brassica cretica]|uniref:Xylanase inhibitor C-terminal domain-containing protein n=1 Tax=Brassica cretica TaxID=69181 RepID=A0ABQ7BN27_BRACR|nr:hypothetical protein DY000_02040823 [Brassica cretica]